jgi:CheY-like chemotaxis protein
VPRRAGARASVLVAEDDPDVIELLQIILRRADHSVTIARDGHQAVERALSAMPDLVLMDVNMPGLDGLSAARELRRRGFDRPIVALTASLGAMDRGQALVYGCDGYLLKPISSSQLLLAIDRFLASA